MMGPSFLGLQNFLNFTSSKVEFLLLWTMSQMMFVALGVFMMMGVNYLKGGFYRLEKAIPYYEVLWTSAPTFLLCSVAIPSMCLLYSHEQENETVLSVKCVGHQWYWSYEYSDLKEVELDSLMLPSEELNGGETRYLEADNRMVIPLGSEVRCLVGSEDVIHAFAIPAMSLKIDATPGRLNLVNLNFGGVGVLYGQCSELCGANHSLMPVVIEVTVPSLFKEWLGSF